MRSIRLTASMLAVLMVAGAVAACATPDQPAGKTPAAQTPAAGTPAAKAATPAAKQETPVAASKAPAELRVGLGAMPAAADPAAEVSLLAKVVFNLVFDRLVERDPQGRLVPALAERWENPNPTTWVFTLRRNVRFANGEPFNAQAVKANLDRITNPDNRLANAQRFTQIERTEVVDDGTIRIITRQPTGTLFAALAWLELTPPNLAANNYQEFLRAPLGTGSYRVETWAQNDRVVLVPVQDSWRGPGPVGRITIRHIPEDATRVAGVQGGDLDIGYALPSDAIEAVRGRGAQVVTPVIGQSAAVYFRPASTEAGPIANKQVREAIAHAMDIDGIIRNTVGGIPQRNAQISGPDGFGYNPDLRGFPHNPARARELLAQAGFPNGFTTRLDTPIGRYLKDREISEAVAGQLSQVGVRMEVNTLEFAVYLQNFLNARLSPMFLAGVSYAPEMDINQPLAFFTSANSARIAADPAYDALYQRSAIEPNPQERERLLQQAMRQVHDEVWAVYFFQIPSINGVRPSAAGVGFRPDYSMDLSRWR